MPVSLLMRTTKSRLVKLGINQCYCARWIGDCKRKTKNYHREGPFSSIYALLLQAEKSGQVSLPPLRKSPPPNILVTIIVGLPSPSLVSYLSKLSFLRRKRRKGQTLVEYALILAFISVVAISVLLALGSRVKEVFTTITSQLAIANSSH
jgi:Flp pilus assembly pilin Flp